MASSKASIAGHPFHPMLIVFPIGLWIFALVCQIVDLAGGGETWRWAAAYSLAGGCIGAAVAAVPGLIDLFSMPPSPARTVGIWHMGLNIVALIIFLSSFFLLFYDTTSRWAPLVLSIIGAILLLASGWLGGDMVYRHGVAVEPEAFSRKKARGAVD